MLLGETSPRGTGKVVAPLTFLRGVLCLDSEYHKTSKSCAKLQPAGYAHHAYTTGQGPTFKPHQPNDVTIGVLVAADRRAGSRREGRGDHVAPADLPHRVRHPEHARTRCAA